MVRCMRRVVRGVRNSADMVEAVVRLAVTRGSAVVSIGDVSAHPDAHAGGISGIVVRLAALEAFAGFGVTPGTGHARGVVDVSSAAGASNGQFLVHASASVFRGLVMGAVSAAFVAVAICIGRTGLSVRDVSSVPVTVSGAGAGVFNGFARFDAVIVDAFGSGNAESVVAVWSSDLHRFLGGEAVPGSGIALAAGLPSRDLLVEGGHSTWVIAESDAIVLERARIFGIGERNSGNGRHALGQVRSGLEPLVGSHVAGNWHPLHGGAHHGDIGRGRGDGIRRQVLARDGRILERDRALDDDTSVQGTESNLVVVDIDENWLEIGFQVGSWDLDGGKSELPENSVQHVGTFLAEVDVKLAAITVTGAD